MGGVFSKPKAPVLPAAPDPSELEAQAEAEAAAEAEALRKGRVKTVLTTGQGRADEGATQQRRTVLGG